MASQGSYFGFPGHCPDRLRFENNIILLINNDSATLFDGDFNASNGVGWNFEFENNLYYSFSDKDLKTCECFGGMSKYNCIL